MIMRLLLLLLVIVGALLLRNKLKGKGATKVTPPQAGKAPETMQRCAHCGVYFPLSEAVHEQELTFCSEQHRQQYLAAPRQ